MPPQFSIKPPFIDFDPRYIRNGHLQHGIKWHYWPDFAFEGLQDRTSILYRTEEFYDSVHCAMFLRHKFAVTHVAGAKHEVAGYLKRSPQGNILQRILDHYCDFSRSFGPAELAILLGDLATIKPLRHLLGSIIPTTESQPLRWTLSEK